VRLEVAKTRQNVLELLHQSDVRLRQYPDLVVGFREVDRGKFDAGEVSRSRAMM
jgi:hypothetical protein